MVTVYLKRKGGVKYLVTALPCLAMLVITGWAMVLNEMQYIRTKNHVLSIIGAVVLILAVWMTIETVLVFCKTRSTEA